MSKHATRFAPSPTGEPHIGNIRTALFAWGFARANRGAFYVRIEDTDKKREIKGSIDKILESLTWLAVDYDEFKNKRFSNQKRTSAYKKIIFQSDRLNVYKRHAHLLLKNNSAYICTCKEERLKHLRESQISAKKPPMYDRHCRDKKLTPAPNEPFVIRLKIPTKGNLNFNDLIHGKLSFAYPLIDDHVLLKSDGYPTYHLANVVDDHQMNITHVIRGEDWLPSTPKHIQLYKAFGWNIPFFAHVPMILGKDKSKLSKRHSAISVLEYKKKGYLPEAVFNYLVLLGWNPGNNEEIFSQKEFIKIFTLERVQKSPAIFDTDKLNWMNALYLRKMPARNIKKRLQEWDPESNSVNAQMNNATITEKRVAFVQERMITLNDYKTMTGFLDNLPQYAKNMLVFKKSSEEQTAHIISQLRDLFADVDDDASPHELKKAVEKLIQTYGVGSVLHPLRVALAGQKDSPGPFEIAHVLGKAECLHRLEIAQKKLE